MMVAHARRRRLAVALLLLVAIIAPPPSASAEDAPEIDYLGLLARTQDELSHFVAGAKWPGHDGALEYIWKSYVQKRAKRAQRFYRELQKESRWVLDEESERAEMLKPDSWSPWFQRVGKAYSELAAARDGLKKINVSPKSAIKNWIKRNPEPDLNRQTPAERALDSIRASIALYVRSGRVVPHWMYQRESDLVAEALEERRALEAAHARWIVVRKEAIAAIHAAVEETKSAALLERQRLELHLRNTQELVAELQGKEEQRIRDRIKDLPEDPKLAKAATEQFAKMAAGRKAGARYSTAKSSKYSSLVRKGWMQPRSRLVSAIRAAVGRHERAQAEAEAAAGAGGAPVKPEEAKPKEGDGSP